jgi:UDP-N-acetylmuramate dehydrogenase
MRILIEITKKIKGQSLFNEPLSKYTSWKVGGPADIFFIPQSRNDLSDFLKSNHDKPITWLGNGTNILVRDGGIRGAVIATKKSLNEIKKEENNACRVEVGASCMDLALFAEKNELGPAAFFSGIPGSIGGALVMNAGSFGHETWNFVDSVEVIDEEGVIHHLNRKDFKVSYRTVKYPFPLWFVSCLMKFSESETTTKSELKEYRDQRLKTQPLNEDTCGSVFKNPEKGHAGALIERAGLKGHRIGGCSISNKHANFIVNEGSATSKNIEDLIKHVQKAVKKKHNIDLETEVRILGED